MTATTDLLPSYLDVTRLASASFLARYRQPTLAAYTQDLKAFLGWCQRYELEVLKVTRGELEMYLRHLEPAATPLQPSAAGSAPSPPSTSTPSSTASSRRTLPMP